MGFAIILAIVGSIFPGFVPAGDRKTSKPRPRRVRDHPTRKQILGILSERPGRSISDLCRAIGAGWGTVQHHLYLLGKAGLIRSVVLGRSHRFFNGTDGAKHLSNVALLLRGRVNQLASMVVREPGIGQRRLTEHISMSRKVLREYVDLLIAHGLIQEVRQSKFRFYYPAPALQELLDILPPQSDVILPSADPVSVASSVVVGPPEIPSTLTLHTSATGPPVGPRDAPTEIL